MQPPALAPAAKDVRRDGGGRPGGLTGQPTARPTRVAGGVQGPQTGAMAAASPHVQERHRALAGVPASRNRGYLGAMIAR